MTPFMINTAAAPISSTSSMGLLQSCFATLREWKMRAESRTALTKMSDAQLRDCGVIRADIDAIAAKPFWKA